MDFLSPEYWENRYKKQQTGWDVGAASLPLTAYINSIENKDAAVLIPGCGNGYEAEYLVANGFTNVTVIDIASSPVEELGIKLKEKAKILQEDFFDHSGVYDYILEQTFLCALDPSLRKSYAVQMHHLLKAGGKLAGVLFNWQFETNPPFGGNKEEYLQLFSDLFTVEKMETCYNSIPARAGTELFFIARKTV
jgi:methyl halide transferase